VIMNYLKRAIYSVRHRFIKNVLLTITFTVIFAVSLGALALLISTNKQVEQMQKTLANAVTLGGDIFNGEDEDTGFMMYNSYNVLLSDAKKITESEYVIVSNYSDYCDVNIEELQSIKRAFSWYDMYIEDHPDAEWANAALVLASNAEYCDMFTAYGFRLTEGEYFNEKDENKIIVTKDYAEFNNLKVGDEITVSTSYYDRKYHNMTEDEILKIQFTICGVMEIPKGYVQPEMDNGYWTDPQNFMVASYENGSMFLRKLENYYDFIKEDRIPNVTVYLKDMSDLDKFISEMADKLSIKKVVREMSEYSAERTNLSWDEHHEKYYSNPQYILYVDEMRYNMIAKPLERTRNLASAFITVIIICTAILVILIFSFSLKGRNKEFAMLLAMGESKFKVILQVLTETLVPVMLALILGFFIGQNVIVPITESYGQNITKQSARETQTDNDRLLEVLDSNYQRNLEILPNVIYNRNPIAMVVQDEIEFKLDAVVFLYYIFIALALVVLALFIQMYVILKAKPSELLRKKN